MVGTTHIAIWGAWYGSRNVGDQALLLSIADMLDETFDSVKLTVFTDDKVHVANYMAGRTSCEVEVLQNRPDIHRVLHTLATCDLFIFGGGVPFYEDRYHLLVMSLLVGTAKLCRTPYLMWSVSSQNVVKAEAMRVFRWVLQGACVITYRDDATQQLFSRCGVDKPMEKVADPVFRLHTDGGKEEAEKLIELRNDSCASRPLVALTPRLLRGKDGEAETHYNPKSQQDLDREISSFAAAVDWLWEHNYQPIFVPMNTVAPDDDRVASTLVIEQATHGDKCRLIDQPVSPVAAAYVYQHCECAFVARVHGSITAMMGQCPVMMYAFAPKHSGIMNTMGLSEYILLQDSVSIDATVKMLSKLSRNAADIRVAMASRLEILRADALRPAKLAAAVAERGE